MASFWNGLLTSRGGESLAKARGALVRLGGHVRFWLKALSQPTIDLSLRTHAGQRTRIIEFPGRSLPPAELDALISQLKAVAAKTLPQESLTYGIFSGQPEPLS